jgi:hypothetical protein
MFFSILQALSQLLPEGLVSVSDQEHIQSYHNELYKSDD